MDQSPGAAAPTPTVDQGEGRHDGQPLAPRLNSDNDQHAIDVGADYPDDDVGEDNDTINKGEDEEPEYEVERILGRKDDELLQFHTNMSDGGFGFPAAAPRAAPPFLAAQLRALTDNHLPAGLTLRHQTESSRAAQLKLFSRNLNGPVSAPASWTTLQALQAGIVLSIV